MPLSLIITAAPGSSGAAAGPPLEPAANAAAARPDAAEPAEPVPVLHVITGLDAGGAERMLVRLLTVMPDPRVRPTVVSLTPGGAFRPVLEAAGIAVHDLGMQRGRPGPGGVLRLAGLIRRLRPAVVQGWMYHADLVATAALALSGRRRTTALFWGIRCSDMDVGRYGRGLRLTIRACAALSRRPDAVVANSVAGAAVHCRLGYRPRRVVVIPNGIDTGQFRPRPALRAPGRAALGLPAAAVVAVCVARVDPMKDHAGLLAAHRRLRDHLGDAAPHLLLVGAGTAALPAQPGVTAIGRRGDVDRVLATADLYVSGSAFGEGFSNAIAEAMAAGLPVVTTDVGDSARIVGPCGRVVPPADPAALADALAALVTLPDAARRALGAAARARMETEFPLANAVNQFADLHTSTAAVVDPPVAG